MWLLKTHIHTLLLWHCRLIWTTESSIINISLIPIKTTWAEDQKIARRIITVQHTQCKKAFTLHEKFKSMISVSALMADCEAGSKQINLPNIWHCCDMKDYDLDNRCGNRASKQFVMGKGRSLRVKEMYQKFYKENTART